ncbi:PIR Superfamily Protein [Plasmodium ovale wallikeri]|uniref:PIR protein n=2 Tax=Plasmodium ovale TaxID=36330 RepID=A0A1C3KJ59_PLAOA|nr:PIR Superfamily Protein [Plasmodium ovale wallikeri]SBT73881.1 PIR protein [Plasmodium ovale]
MAETDISNIIKRLEEFNNLLHKGIGEEEKVENLFNLVSSDFSTVNLNFTLNKLYRNYNVFKSYKDILNNDLYCMYLNNWLNKERNKYMGSQGNPSENTFTSKVLENNETAAKKSHQENFPCALDIKKYSQSIIKVRDKLHNLCGIRNNFNKKLSILKNKDECFEFYKYMYKNINSILAEIANSNDNDIRELNDIIKKFKCNGSGIHNIFTEIPCEYERLSEKSTKRDCKGEHCNLEITENEDYNCNCTYNDIFVSIFFSILGTFLLCFVLYKFSPIGSWLSRQKEREKQIRKNLDDESFHEYLEDASSPTQGTTENIPYHMPYHTLKN